MAKTRVGVRVPSLWNGLLSYYRADETPNDQKGNHNGTLVNGTTYDVGVINQGFKFDGINDTVSLTDEMNVFSSSDTFSYNVWVKPNDGTYFFKKSHSYGYALAIMVQLNSICE